MDVLHGKLTSLLRQLSLAAVVREAVNANLDVQAVGRFVAAGRENVREVRADLLPQFDISSRGRIIDDDRANVAQPERLLIGVIIGLLVAQSYFGFMTFLGVISLAGIVINNAIVLLDRIRIEIDDNGLAPARAVIEASQRRLRPILLTTCTTVGGLLPLWFGGGPMWEPMAISII
jgi:hypothetical protein